MKHVGLIIEMDDSGIKETNAGMITMCRQEGMTLTALVLGNTDDRIKDFLSQYGVNRIATLTLPDETALDNPEACARALAQAAEKLGLQVLVGLSSAPGKDLIPRVAARMDAPLLMDCVGLDLARDRGTTSQYSGKILADIELTGAPVLFGVRPNSVKAEEQPATPEEIDLAVEAALPDNFEILPQDNPEASSADQVSLAEANIIIAGGRGMKDKEHFKLIFECAKKMKAAVGASRVAVDQDWIAYAHQVGQTGEKVSPPVYIACGISGSIQHFAGMKTAGMIIAVNTDENAAIMANCDYYVNGDLFEILPELIKQL